MNDIFGLNGIIPSDKTVPLVRKIRDFMFGSGSVSVSMGVTIYFWSFYLYDSRLVMPKNVLVLEPIWFNHCIHTFNTVFMMIEMLCTYHKYPSNFTTTLWSGIYMSGYFVWLVYLKYQTNVWVYPIFEALSPIPRVGFMILTVVLHGILNLLLKMLNKFVWRSRVNKVKWSE